MESFPNLANQVFIDAVGCINAILGAVTHKNGGFLVLKWINHRLFRGEELKPSSGADDPTDQQSQEDERKGGEESNKVVGLV